MKIWRYTCLDIFLCGISFFQLVMMVMLPAHWQHMSSSVKGGSFIFLTLLMTYNIIVVSHLFTHTPWFQAPWLNDVISMINSINIGQSIQAYHLTHVRNHHRYNNDRTMDGKDTKDFSSTFRGGEAGEHVNLMRYAFLGALETLKNIALEYLCIYRFCRVSKHEKFLLKLVSSTPGKKQHELRQVQRDRLARCMWLIFALSCSWQWVLFCYLPAFYLALSFVNVQNYFEHYGADPNHKTTNSVSYYGKLYNFLTFNDGYHQEHHLQPTAHWSTMPSLYEVHQVVLNTYPRVISPFPAILGFLDRKRMVLHKINVVFYEQEEA